MKEEDKMIGIKDMKMPKSCMECKFCVEGLLSYCECMFTDRCVGKYNDVRDIDCPLVEIKENEEK
jgi:hypothetical protein